MRFELTLEGLHCENCSRTVAEALRSSGVVTDARVHDDLRHADIDVAGPADIAEAVSLVQTAGYRVTGFRPLAGSESGT